MYFEDCSYLPGSGGADKGWIFNEKCLVNAINFMRDGYDALTLYIDDISFGKEAKPVDPNDRSSSSRPPLRNCPRPTS